MPIPRWWVWCCLWVIGCSSHHETNAPPSPEGGSNPPELHIVPGSVALRPSATAHFVALGAGTEAVPVHWSISEAAGGTIDASGNYAAPAAEGVFHVVATSSADASLTAQANVTVAAVGACSNLPMAGAWENITPLGTFADAVNGTVGAAIIVDPFDSRTVWLGTGGENDEIWRSSDCGGSWSRVNTGPGSVDDKMGHGGVGDGAQWSMMADPVDQNVLYAVSGYGAESLWKTSDGGQSWTDILLGSEYIAHADYRFVNNVSLDPSNHLHLLVATHGGCSAPYAPNCMAETLDGGNTWRTFVAPQTWQEGGGIVVIAGGTWVWCGGVLMVTKDSGATWSKDALEGGGGCEAEYTIRPLTPASNGNYYLGSRSGVIRSADGVHWQHVGMSSGTLVMLAQGSSRVFAADQWNATVRSAPLLDDTTWTDLPAPPQIAMGHDHGIPFMAYDDAHHLLYASLFSGGVARMVVGD